VDRSSGSPLLQDRETFPKKLASSVLYVNIKNNLLVTSCSLVRKLLKFGI